jgi:hypothetical protein
MVTALWLLHQRSCSIPVAHLHTHTFVINPIVNEPSWSCCDLSVQLVSSCDSDWYNFFQILNSIT